MELAAILGCSQNVTGCAESEWLALMPPCGLASCSHLAAPFDQLLQPRIFLASHTVSIYGHETSREYGSSGAADVVCV